MGVYILFLPIDTFSFSVQFVLIPMELPSFLFGCVFRGRVLGLIGLLGFCNDRHVDAAFVNSFGDILLSLDECDVEQLVETG